MDPIISIHHLNKHYGAKKVLNDISIDINPGQIIGYIGPNGAGKSTTVKILKAKLTMDNRRPSTFEQMQKRKEQKELNKTSLQTMFGSLAIGSLLLISFAIGSDLTTKLTFFFTLFIFLLAATLISDFTSVLIDIKDNMIILPKPVNDATFVTSRLLHIAIHLNKILLPMLLPAIILFFIKGNRVVVIPFIFMAFIAALLSIFLINAIYILILKITTPEKFRSIISYIQIGLAIAIYGSYQLVPRLMEASVGRSLQVSQLKYIRLSPPFWFAETCKSFSVFSFGNMQLLSLALSIIIPLLSMLVVVKYLAPAFTQKLSMINSSAVEIASGLIGIIIIRMVFFYMKQTKWEKLN